MSNQPVEVNQPMSTLNMYKDRLQLMAAAFAKGEEKLEKAAEAFWSDEVFPLVLQSIETGQETAEICRGDYCYSNLVCKLGDIAKQYGCRLEIDDKANALVLHVNVSREFIRTKLESLNSQ